MSLNTPKSLSTWLLMDTACPRAVIGIAQDGVVLSELFLDEPRQHDVQLASAIDHVLALASCTFDQLEGVAVGKGPGSFIGMRLAMAHAKGICVAKNIPLVGISSLLAFAGADGVAPGEGIVAIDARRGEFFMQAYTRIEKNGEIEIHTNTEPSAISHADAEKLPLSIGRGATAAGLLVLLKQRLAEVSDIQELDEAYTLLPTYVRAPDARLPNSK